MEANKKAEPVSDKKTQLKEEYRDSIWRLIMYDYAEYEGEKFLNESKEAKKDPRFQKSEKTNKIFYKILNGYFQKQKLLSISNKSKGILTKVAVVFFAMSAAFAFTFTTVEAFRVQVLNLVLTVQKEYTSVQLIENGENKSITAGLSDIYAPTYIPAGYWIYEIVDMGHEQIIEYINADEQYITFMSSSSSTISNVDTENAEIAKSIKIHEEEEKNRLYVFKNGVSTVSWIMNNRVFVIYAQISEAEIIQIAESVIFIK